MARRVLGRPFLEDAAEWAIGQLVSGRDTPHLRQLAGATGTENAFEMEELFDRTVRELGVSAPSLKSAVVLYAQELAREYLLGRVTREVLLEELCQLFLDHPKGSLLRNFYLLRWTHHDFKYSEVSHYYDGATRENFEELLRSEINALLAASQEV